MLFLRFEKENQIRSLVYFECFYSMSILFQFILPWLSNLRIFPFGKLEFKDHTYTYTITYMHNICTKGTIHIRKKFGKGLVENMSCHGMYGIFSSITWEISVFERYWTFFLNIYTRWAFIYDRTTKMFEQFFRVVVNWNHEFLCKSFIRTQYSLLFFHELIHLTMQNIGNFIGEYKLNSRLRKVQGSIKFKNHTFKFVVIKDSPCIFRRHG